MIRDIRVIEGIHAQIQHAVVRVLVLQNIFIYRPLCKGIPELAFGDKVGGIEIALIYALNSADGGTKYYPEGSQPDQENGSSAESLLLSDDIEEERRLFYVAMTRARHHLYVVVSEDNMSSRFLIYLE